MRADFLKFASACRTARGFFDRYTRHPVIHSPHDLRDDIVAAPDPYGRADKQAFALNIAPVVEGRPADGNAGKIHRADMAKRRDLARPARFPGDRQQRRRAFFRLKFIGHSPPGKFIGIAKYRAGGLVGDLDDRSVNQKIKCIPLGFHFLQRCDDLLSILRHAQQRRDGEAVFFHEGKHARLIIVGRILYGADLIEKSAQPP